MTIAALEYQRREVLGRALLEDSHPDARAGRRRLPPSLAPVGFSETFVEPALARLRAQGAEIRFGARLKALTFGPHRVSDLVFDAGSIELGSDDHVILAVPAAIAARLVPTLTVPNLYSPIVNAHFRCDSPRTRRSLAGWSEAPQSGSFASAECCR